MTAAGIPAQRAPALGPTAGGRTVLELRGAVTVVVGIQSDVGVAMIQLGLRLDGVTTALDRNARPGPDRPPVRGVTVT
jgi:hypothetical protein